MPTTEPKASSGHATSNAGALVGREIAGRYRIRSKLGEGAMGAVFQAEQISLKRAVAVKVLKPDLASSELLLRRFNAEAEAVAKLNHPNTVTIFDFGQDSDGSLFIAMELIDGKSLRSVIQQEAPFSVHRALSIAAQIAASLADAHSQNIVHRDLKPDNVMLQERGRTRDIVRVLDFGIAKLRDEGRASQIQMTQEGDVIGTPQYMSPEQIRADAIDGRTDIYALGCILYEMITARLPHEATSVMALLSKHLLEEPVPPSQRRSDLVVPAAVEQLITRTMAKDPAARPATMEQLGELITSLLDSTRSETTKQSSAVGSLPTLHQIPLPAQQAQPLFSPPPLPPPPPRPAVRPGRSNRTALLVIAGVLAVGGVVAAWDASSSASSTDEVSDPGDEIPSYAGVLPPGTELTTPPGFEVVTDAPAGKLIIDKARSVAIGLGPILLPTTDPQEVANLWALEQNVKFERLTKITSHGAERWVGVFSSIGRLDAYKQMAISFEGSNYRIAVVITAPPPLFDQPEFQQWVAQFLERNVRLP